MRTGYSSHTSSPLMQTSAALAIFHPAMWSPLTRFVTALTILGGLAVAFLPMDWYEPPIDMQGATAAIQGGTANVVRRDSATTERLGDGSVVNLRAGDLISSDTGGVVVHLFDGQTAVLESGARLTIEKLERREDATWVHLAVWAGRTTFNVPNAPGPSDLFQISSPSSATIIRGTEIAIEVVSPQETLYDVYRGVAYVRLDEQELFLSANERVRAIVDESLQLESSKRNVPALQLPVTTVGSMRTRATAVPTESDPAEFWPTPLPGVAPPSVVADVLAASTSAASTSATATSAAASPDDNAASPGGAVYHVQSGDTLWAIAARHGLPVDALLAANPHLSDASVLQIDQEILLPPE